MNWSYFIIISRCNKYLLEFERLFTIPESHLALIGERLGILGHPREIYDSSLTLNKQVQRRMKWNENYDPFGLI
jgi:hypothetical protein